jgi:pimeloyl-ACP methyl ester carboxylesterase
VLAGHGKVVLVTTEHFVRVGDVTLFVRELGERRPDRRSLVVLHGGPDVGHSYLLPGVERLAGDHHVVLFDFRGCGRSSRGLPIEELQPEYVVQDTHRLIKELQLGPVDLLGFSTGGRAATAFVARYPSDVRRLILASTSAYPSSESDRYLEGCVEYQRRQACEQAAQGRLRNSTILVWNLDMAPRYLQLLEGLDQGDWSYEAYLDGRIHPWVNGDAEAILRNCGKPILILHGEKDMGFPLQLAERLHQAVPSSVLAVIDGAAHMCHFEKPELWSELVHEFIDNPLART